MTLPVVTVDVGFTLAVASSNYWHIGDPARGKIGTAMVGPDELWTDVTDYTAVTGGPRVSITRGSNRVEGPALRYEAGQCSIALDNSDRRFDPTNLAGPYVTGGETEVEPMRPVRIRAEHDGVTYQLFQGFADSWLNSFAGPSYAQVTLAATDGFKVLSNYDRIALGAPVGAGEDSGARAGRILDSVLWPTADRILAAGDSTLAGTTLEGAALTELMLVADSELGELYIDGAGRVVFRNRHAILEETRSNTSQVTFGDSGAELAYDDVAVEYDDQTLLNLAQVAREGGTQQTAQDATSRTKYLTHTYNRTDLLLQSDSETLAYAQFIVYVAGQPELRFATLTITAADADNDLFPHLLGREIGDRITVIRRPPGGGDPIERDVFVRGIQHEITDATWKTTWTLQSASKYAFFTIGNPILGRVGLNGIGY